MLIRKARTGDVELIARAICMAEGELAPFFTGTEDEEKSIRVLSEFIVSSVPCRYSLQYCLVAEVEGKPAGMLFSFPADLQPDLDLLILASVNARGYNLKELFFEGEHGTYYLSTMGVDPAYRGQGIGTELMAAAEAEGAAQGFTRISLLVSADKEKARALYERKGYSITARVEMAGFDYFRMGKTLE
jgi:Acetyltransferases